MTDTKMTMEEAIAKVIAEIDAMTPEEFDALLEKHKDGEIAQLLLKAGMV